MVVVWWPGTWPWLQGTLTSTRKFVMVFWKEGLYQRTHRSYLATNCSILIILKSLCLGQCLPMCYSEGPQRTLWLREPCVVTQIKGHSTMNYTKRCPRIFIWIIPTQNVPHFMDFPRSPNHRELQVQKWKATEQWLEQTRNLTKIFMGKTIWKNIMKTTSFKYHKEV